MTLNNEEIEWLKLAIEDNNKFHISVNNDGVFINECVNEETGEWQTVFVFEKNNQELIVQLFNYIGCNASKE